MELIVILGIVTIIVSVVCTYLLRLPGMDLTPIGTIMIAMSGENALIGATVLTIAYKLPKPVRLMWIWVQVPIAYIAAMMALTFDLITVPILLYYAFSAAMGVLIGAGGRYFMAVVFGLCLNIVVGRIYGFTL